MQITGTTSTGISEIRSLTSGGALVTRYNFVNGESAGLLTYTNYNPSLLGTGATGYFADTATFNGGGTLYRDIFGFAPKIVDIGGGQHISLTCYYSLFYMASPSTDTITTTAHGNVNVRFISGATGAWSVLNNYDSTYHPSGALGGDEFRGAVLNSRPLIRMRSYANGTAAAGTLTKIAFYGIIHQAY